MFLKTEERPQGEVAIQRGKLKLSEAIRELGYDAMTSITSYRECVLGRAYRKLTGKHLDVAGLEFKAQATEGLYFTECAAKAFGVPFKIALKAEQMCYRGAHTKDQIAEWLASQGL